MSDFNAESLSALMDNEAEELEIRRLLAQVESDGEIRARWCRYHSARSVLQKDQLQYAHIDISAAVREQIENESLHGVEGEAAPTVQTGRAAFNFKQLAGLAVAASVTAVVFFGVQGLNSSAPSTTTDDALAGIAQSPLAEKNVRALPSVQEGQQGQVAAAKFEAAQRLRMQTYLRLHAQQATVNGSQGILPLARVANHEVE
ncbi:MAG: sigma-E factor negative regulatory protein [Pseudomonadales bacterium]